MKTPTIGLTSYDMGDGSFFHAGIRVNADGEFVARTPEGDLKKFAKVGAAASFLAKRGYAADGKKLS